jgi:hypothetical protein
LWHTLKRELMLDDALARTSELNCEETSGAMKFEDALRKIRLLRQVKPENGSSDAEAENPASLVRTLMDRFAVKLRRRVRLTGRSFA